MPETFEGFFGHFGRAVDEFYRRNRPSASGLDPGAVHYAGAFTSPGVGLPMAVVSGEHAAEAVRRDAEQSPFSDVAPNLLA
jgi:hypothetical protein